jgi:TRAP transporter TAXI family solute receptor
MTAAGLDPGRDIERFQISLPETTQRMKAKTLDAFFFSGGPPALGVTEILTADRQEFRLIPTDDVMKPLVATFGPAYQTVPIPAKVYDTPSDVPTITVNNLLIVNPALPADLVYDFTAVLFQHKAELTKAHAAGADLDPATGGETQPTPLHPGAARYYAKRP